jgi:hypothetical protein
MNIYYLCVPYGSHRLEPPRVEVCSNTSIVALRVVGGEEREPSAQGYNWATLYGHMTLQIGGASNLRE